MASKHEGISFIELEQVSEQFIFEDRYPTDVLVRMREATAAALNDAPWAHGRQTGERVLHLMDEELIFRFGRSIEQSADTQLPS